MSFFKKLYSGRIGSLAYLVGILLSWVSFWVMSEIGKIISHNTFMSVVEILLSLVLFWFMFSVFVRRLHDLNKSGWLSLLVFIPIANAILGIILLFKPGDREANRFGVSPQGGKYVIKELFIVRDR